MMINKIVNKNKFGCLFIITCPVCGFTFKLVGSNTRKQRVRCPICGSNIFQKIILYTEIK